MWDAVGSSLSVSLFDTCCFAAMTIVETRPKFTLILPYDAERILSIRELVTCLSNFIFKIHKAWKFAELSVCRCAYCPAPLQADKITALSQWKWRPSMFTSRGQFPVSLCIGILCSTAVLLNLSLFRITHHKTLLCSLSSTSNCSGPCSCSTYSAKTASH